jgi:hypothetical protein
MSSNLKNIPPTVAGGAARYRGEYVSMKLGRIADPAGDGASGMDVWHMVVMASSDGDDAVTASGDGEGA